jgi:hypothetical protein
VDPVFEQQIPQRCSDEAAQETERSKLPCLFSFPGARIHSCHEKDDIQRGQHIEDLQCEVPNMPPVLGRRRGEYIEISRTEDDGVEDLGDEGDTWALR